ncbi:hypothetical protein FRX31_009026 [Thalictrum thalictroides]|uniref:Uncharacterized protein n=1 Tax=Thalictrum thalictroides TaxID=46969 RepID=A0A7J6WVH6_THATH|nr:hypothetical protein FRX31_009026 [Thalictrum thalictroides]
MITKKYIPEISQFQSNKVQQRAILRILGTTQKKNGEGDSISEFKKERSRAVEVEFEKETK